MDTIASALLPLIIAEKDRILQVVNHFISSQSNENIRNRLQGSFNALVNENGLILDLNRANRKTFNLNLKSFVTDVRGYMKTN